MCSFVRSAALLMVVRLSVGGVQTVASAAGSMAPGRTRWVVRDVGTLGGAFNRATDINERGQVVGSSRTKTGAPRAFLWQDGQIRDIGAFKFQPYGPSSGPWLNEKGQVIWYRGGVPVVWQDGVTTKIPLAGAAVNDQGQIFGATKGGMGHAALWDGGGVRDLGVLPGDQLSSAIAVNGNGLVLGFSGDTRRTPPRARVFLWQNGTMRDLGVPPGFAPKETNCQPVALNDRGQVLAVCAVGFFDVAHSHAVLWQDGKMRDIGVFSPTLLNDRGDVVGATRVPGRPHAVLWQNDRKIDLGTLGGRSTYAYALNDRGQVVGESATKTGAFHAFVWENGTMTDLGTLPGDRYSHAWAINDKGMTVGTSVKGGYNGPSNGGTSGYKTPSHAVLWTQR